MASDVAPVPFVVALDVDEVLVQYLAGYMAYYNNAHGTSWAVSDFNTYKFWLVHGGSQEECVTDIYKFHDSPYFQEQLEVVPGALEALQELAAIPGVELHVVTSRHAEIEEATNVYLERHFPGLLPRERVHVGNHWGTAEQPRVSKPAMCQKIGAKVLVDDSSDYCKEIATYDLQAVLFDWEGAYGWNKEGIEDASANIVRAKDWPAVVARIRELLAEESRKPQNDDLPTRGREDACCGVTGCTIS